MQVRSTSSRPAARPEGPGFPASLDHLWLLVRDQGNGELARAYYARSDDRHLVALSDVHSPRHRGPGYGPVGITGWGGAQGLTPPRRDRIRSSLYVLDFVYKPQQLVDARRRSRRSRFFAFLISRTR